MFCFSLVIVNESEQFVKGLGSMPKLKLKAQAQDSTSKLKLEGQPQG